MIGFVLAPAQATAILSAIEFAQTSRGLPVYWTPGGFTIFHGPFAGSVFIPFDDNMRSTNLRGGLTPMDFPETVSLLTSLGGLEARINLETSAIIEEVTP